MRGRESQLTIGQSLSTSIKIEVENALVEVEDRSLLLANHSRPRLRSRSRTHCSRSRIAAYYRPITLDLGLNRGRERIVRDRERIVYVWKFIEKMDFDLGKIIFIFRRSSFLLKCNLAAADNWHTQLMSQRSMQSFGHHLANVGHCPPAPPIQWPHKGTHINGVVGGMVVDR